MRLPWLFAGIAADFGKQGIDLDDAPGVIGDADDDMLVKGKQVVLQFLLREAS